MTSATLPFELNNERFVKKWQEYVDYRKERKLARLLPRSVQKQWDYLASFGIEVACEAIEQTLRNQWTGIFPDKVRLSGSGAVLRSGEARASLGALQIQLKKVEGELEDLIYPGGCAFPRTLTLEQSIKADLLRAQRQALKERIAYT